MKQKKTNKDFKVDFIGIGVPRAGTTWISECLQQHPDICFSKKKEIGFFNNDYEYQKGIEYYQTYFNHCSGNGILGEFTPDYFLRKKTAMRIKNFFPNVKLIINLRNPIDRFYSQFLFSKMNCKLGRNVHPNEIIESNDIKHVQSGHYYEALKNYLEVFSRNQIIIMFYDDIKKDPHKFIKKIYSYLSVKPGFVPDVLLKKRNDSGRDKYKNELIQKYFSKFYGFEKAFKATKHGEEFTRLLKLCNLDKLKIWTHKQNINKSIQKKVFKELDGVTRGRLYGLYEKDIKKLENLLEKKLDHWK